VRIIVSMRPALLLTFLATLLVPSPSVYAVDEATPSTTREPESANVAAKDILSLSKIEDGKTLLQLGWKGGNQEDGKKDFSIVTEKGNAFIRSSYILGTEAKYLYKEVDWDTEKYPYLHWKWRARKFPPKADIFDSKRSDAPAQVYILWRFFPRYYVLKYFWGSHERVGRGFKDGNVLTGALFGEVIRSGGPWDVWHSESQNIREAFKKAFGQKPPGNVRGIGVLSDGDDSQGESEADFADFEASKSP